MIIPSNSSTGDAANSTASQGRRRLTPLRNHAAISAHSANPMALTAVNKQLLVPHLVELVELVLVERSPRGQVR